MTLVWMVFGGILALNVVVVTGAAISFGLERYRCKKEINLLETLWRLEPRRLIRSEGSGSSARVPHRSVGRRLVAPAVVASLLFAGTALASPEARDAVKAVLATVADGLPLLGPSGERVAAQGERGEPIGPGRVGNDGSDVLVPAGLDPTGLTAGLGGVVSEATDPEAIPSPTVIDPPSATAVTAVANSNAIELAWTNVATETSYSVERSSDGGTEWFEVAAPGQDVTTHIERELPPGTTYHYRVVAVNDGGPSEPSAETSATTSPASSTGLTADAVSSTEIELDWEEVTAATEYRVERSPDGATEWFEVTTTPPDVTTYSDSELSAGTTYYYRVVAVNAAGRSPATDAVAAITLSDTPSSPAIDETTP